MKGRREDEDGEWLASRRDLLRCGAGIALGPVLSGPLAGLIAQSDAEPPAAESEEQYRIAFLKVNGHSWWFGAYFAWFDEEGYLKNAGGGRLKRFENRFEGQLPFRTARMTKVWDPEPDKAVNFASVFRGVEPVSTREEALQNADAVIIPDASGFGEDHLALVRPCMERKLPTFVDKPLARRLGDCLEMERLSKQHDTPLLSFSTLRYAPLVYQARELYPDMKDVVHVKGGGIGHLFLYGIHPLEMLCAFRGPGVVGVANVGTTATEVIRLRYREGPMMVATVFVRNQPGGYAATHITVFGRRGNVNLFMDRFIEMSHEAAFRGFAAFIESIRTRRPSYPLSDTTEIIRILLAAQRSRLEGSREVLLEEIGPADEWLEEQ